MPSTVASVRFWATACIAQPSFVRVMNSWSAPMTAPANTTFISSSHASTIAAEPHRDAREERRERQRQRRPELLERVADEQAQADGGDDERQDARLEEPGHQELPDDEAQEERRTR